MEVGGSRGWIMYKIALLSLNHHSLLLLFTNRIRPTLQ